jgi:uncharacterized protein (TIGR00730 family)
VFAGARSPRSSALTKLAADLGVALAQNGTTIVYGGGSHGLMGSLADAALAAGGRVVGVIPESMVIREWAHRGLAELHVVPNMHARKAKMNELSHAFVALPGGIGTLEELFEVYTWAQLGFHAKPIAVLDGARYYEPLLTMLDRMVDEDLLAKPARECLHAALDVESLMRWLEQQFPGVNRAG